MLSSVERYGITDAALVNLRGILTQTIQLFHGITDAAFVQRGGYLFLHVVTDAVAQLVVTITENC